MGIYIKNINMPTERNEMILRIQPDGAVFDKYAHYVGMFASYVPPHERLIEESRVLDIVSAWCPDDDRSVSKVGDLREMLDEIEALPTIIPASEKSEV